MIISRLWLASRVEGARLQAPVPHLKGDDISSNLLHFARKSSSCSSNSPMTLLSSQYDDHNQHAHACQCNIHCLLALSWWWWLWWRWQQWRWLRQRWCWWWWWRRLRPLARTYRNSANSRQRGEGDFSRCNIVSLKINIISIFLWLLIIGFLCWSSEQRNIDVLFHHCHHHHYHHHNRHRHCHHLVSIHDLAKRL